MQLRGGKLADSELERWKARNAVSGFVYPKGPCRYMDILGPESRYMGTPLGPKYIPYTYMDPLG